MKAVEIAILLRSQFYKPGHRLEVGRPEDGGSGWTAIYEIYADGDRTLWARIGSSSDAEAIVTAINAACSGKSVRLAPSSPVAQKEGE